MKVYREISLSEFEFWAGAKDRVKYLRRRNWTRSNKSWRKLTQKA